MAQKFTEAEWDQILKLLPRSGERYGLPVRRRHSLVLGSFNIRKLGQVKNKSAGAWELLRRICQRYDLLAVQEVQDNLEGLRHLQSLLGGQYQIIVSDTTGNFPGDGTTPERLAFVYHKGRVRLGELASDITYDRSKVLGTLFKHRQRFADSFAGHNQKLTEWQIKAAEREAEGKAAPTRPVMRPPEFVTFIRQPHCVALTVGSAQSKRPYRFLAVNVHLLYGLYKEQRRMEFLAIISWLVERAKSKNIYYPDILFMGDCNLDFERPEEQRPIIEAFLKSLNFVEGLEANRKYGELNFPFLDKHPQQEAVFRTAARLEDTYDQIAFVLRDERLPDHSRNDQAGAVKDGYDYGVFNFVELFAHAVLRQSYRDLSKAEKQAFIARFEHDVSDHLPIWVRLPMPD